MSLPPATMRTRRTPLTPPRAATEVPQTSGHPRATPSELLIVSRISARFRAGIKTRGIYGTPECGRSPGFAVAQRESHSENQRTPTSGDSRPRGLVSALRRELVAIEHGALPAPVLVAMRFFVGDR